MARGIQVPFTLNPREFLAGLKRIETGLDDVTDEFRTLERRADDAADGTERSMKDAAEDIERAFSGLGREVESEFDRMERAARDADTGMTRNIRQGSFRGAAGALAAEAGDEFVESWGEAVREGNPAGVIREVLSNAALIGGAAFGPVGAAVGLGVALATGVLDGFNRRREQLAALTSGIFDNVTEAETSGREAAEAYYRGFAEVEEIGGRLAQALNVDDEVAAWAEVNRLARATGLDADAISLAILGNRDALGQVQEAIRANDAAYAANRTAAGQVFDVDRDRYLELEKAAGVLGDQKAELGGILSTGRDVALANRTALAADQTRRGVLADVAESAEATRSALSRTRPPGMGALAADLDRAATSAERVAGWVASLPAEKRVTYLVNVRGATAKAQALLNSGVLE